MKVGNGFNNFVVDSLKNFSLLPRPNFAAYSLKQDSHCENFKKIGTMITNQQVVPQIPAADHIVTRRSVVCHPGPMHCKKLLKGVFQTKI